MKVKIILCGCIVLLVACAATAQIPCNPTTLRAATSSVNWPQFQYDAAHTGCNPYESVLSPSKVGNLGVKWQYSSGHGGAYYSSSVVADGTLYTIFTAGRGDYTANVWALNARTGALLWTFTTGVPGGTLSSPAIGKGLVYVGSSDHNVYALDAKTGVLVWQYVTENTVSTPTVANDAVYVTSGNVYALNASTGALIWKSAAGLSYSVPAVTNGIVYVGSPDHNVYALDANTGVSHWSYATGDSVSPPSVASGKVFVGSDGIYALNASTGALIWNYSDQLLQSESTVVANGAVYVSSALGSNIRALDAGSGALLWSSQQGSQSSSELTVVNGMVYVATSVDVDDESYLYAYSLNGQ